MSPATTQPPRGLCCVSCPVPSLTRPPSACLPLLVPAVTLALRASFVLACVRVCSLADGVQPLNIKLLGLGPDPEANKLFNLDGANSFFRRGRIATVSSETERARD